MRLAPTLALLLLASCSTQEASQPAQPSPQQQATQQPRRIELSTKNFRFEPAEVTVAPGEPIVLTLTNNASALHSIVLEFLPEPVRLDRNLAPGESAELTFIAPDKPGAYVFYCPVRDHRPKGMEGRLVVRGGGQRR